VHNQSITAISNNYRRSVNTQIIICAHRRRVLAAGQCGQATATMSSWPRHTVAQRLRGRVVLGDGRYRGITRSPPRDKTRPAALSATTTTAHTAASGPASNTSSPGSKGRQIPRQCRRRGDAINHSLNISVGLWNLKTRNQIRGTT
jgi:hypothetical protein